MKRFLQRSLPCFSFLFCFYGLSGQVRISGDVSFPPPAYNVEILDQTKQNIYYDYTYVENPKKKQETERSLTVLQIGKNFSKFTDFHTLKKDSLQEKFSRLKRTGTNEANQLLAIMTRIGFKMSVIRNTQKNKVFVSGKIPAGGRYIYATEAPNLVWKLSQEHKEILGYKVQKAAVNYSGRTWEAWFAPKIPISLGPYVFGGLPGLILELYDTERNFHFLATGVNNDQEKIYERNEDEIIETTKENFFKMKKSFHERPELFMNGAVRGLDGPESLPYNPIELLGH